MKCNNPDIEKEILRNHRYVGSKEDGLMGTESRLGLPRGELEDRKRGRTGQVKNPLDRRDKFRSSMAQYDNYSQMCVIALKIPNSKFQVFLL